MHTEVGAREVARLIGIPYRTLMHWVTTGLVTPEASVQSKGRRRVRFRPHDPTPPPPERSPTPRGPQLPAAPGA